MAFNEQEQQIIQFARDNGKSREELEEALLRFRTTGSPSVPSVQPQKTPLEKAGGVALGTVKGLTETAIGTAKLAQSAGQRIIAGVDPTRTLEEVREQTGFKSLQGEQVEEISEQLRAKTPEEKIGKGLAFGIELLVPVGKTGIIQKGFSKLKGVTGRTTESAFDNIGATAERVGIRLEDALNPIDEGVETVLRRTDKAKFNNFVNVARKASVEPKAPTGLEIAGKRAEDALDSIQKKLNEFGRQKTAILNQAAVGNKPVGNIAVKFRQNLNSILSKQTLDSGDQKLINDILKEANKLGDNPQAKEIDKFIDFVQDKVFNTQRNLTIDITDGTTSAIRRASGELNEALKTQLPDSYRQANKNFSDLVGLRNELNQKLGKEGERAGALMKRVFSPSDARTKGMFQEVLDVTNIDLVDEAVLARYTMKVFGDKRQQNLLETLIGGGGSVASKVINQLTDTLLGRFKGTEAELRKALRIIEE